MASERAAYVQRLPAEELLHCEEQGGVETPATRLPSATRLLLATTLALTALLACVAALRAGQGGGPFPGRLPSPPGPSGNIVQLDESGRAVQWKLAKPHESCDAACDEAGQTCSKAALLAVDTAKEVRVAGFDAGRECEDVKAWAYDFGPSVCTDKSCCHDGSCTNTCVYGNTGKRGCGVAGSSHHQRLCPCTGDGDDESMVVPHLTRVIDVSNKDMKKIYGHQKFLIFFVAPWCPICRGIMASGGPLEKAAEILNKGKIKTFRMDTVAEGGVPAGYACRYACEYFAVLPDGKKIRFNGNHHDAHDIVNFVKSQ